MKNNKTIMILIIIAIATSFIGSISFSRYSSSFNKTISLVVREPVYSIAFNANGGTGSMNNLSMEYGTSQRLSSNSFTKNDYTFVEWNTNADGTGTRYKNQETVNNLTDVEGEIINLYAIYIENARNIQVTGISLNGTSGSGTNDNEKYYYDSIDSTVTLPNSTSAVTYKVDITNYTANQWGIYSITGLPDNLDYEIANYDLKDKLCDSNTGSGETESIYIKIKYKDGGYVSGNTNYDLDLSFNFKKIYNITYKNLYTANNYPSDVVLANYFDASGNTVNINDIHYPTSLMEGENVSFNFYPHIPNYLNETGNATIIYAKPIITISNPIDDVEIESLSQGDIVMYDHPTSVTFTGNNYIDTKIQLLNSANYKRNFRVELVVENRTGDNGNLNTIFNVMDESGSPWPGVLLRVDGGQYHFEANGGNDGTARNFSYSQLETYPVVIEKIDGIVSVSVNGGTFQPLSNFQNYNRPFNVNATFGSSLNGGNPWRYFNGTVSHMKITYIDQDDAPVIPGQMQTVYEHIPSQQFTGSNNLSTGISLFSQENYDKDFEIVLTVDSVGNGNGSNKETIFNSMDESGSNNYPGFAFRLENDNATNNVLSYVITADMDAAFITYAVNQSNPDNNLKTITFTREDGKLYYQINNQEKKFIYDFVVNNTPKFSTVATYGSSVNNNSVYRGFKGYVSNMVIKMEQ